MKDLSMHIMDILQNSTRAKAKNITLEVLEDILADTLTLVFKDDGCGMSEEMVRNVVNPFFTTRTTRKVGLGLPLLKQNAEMTGGSVEIRSKEGEGTLVTAVFGLSHIDRPPMGDLPGTLVLTIAAHPEIHFVFHFGRSNSDNDTDYVLDTDELYEALDGVSLQEPEVMAYIKEMVAENIR